MWQNFATALGLLSFAMLSALYSSSAARDGRILAAGVSAVVALVIAIGVGIRFVPRLAANVEWEWLPFLTRYHVTREGWIYLGAILVVVFAAINTNNNLLYMVLSALLSVLLLSGFLSGVNFRGIQLELRVPQHCFAGENLPVSIQLHNLKSMFPSFSLTVDNIRETGIMFSSFYVACVPNRSEEIHLAQVTFHSRGRYRFQRVRVQSRYPFGFFVKAREYPVQGECICYPELIPYEQLDLAAYDIYGSSQRFERGLGNDLYMIRNYQPSDSARHVHWKASAKTAALKTREFAAEESRRVTIYFDRFGLIGDTGRFERFVSYAASLFVHLVRSGMDIALVTDEWTSGYDKSESHIEAVLEYLALVQRSVAVDASLPDGSGSAVVLSLRRGHPA